MRRGFTYLYKKHKVDYGSKEEAKACEVKMVERLIQTSANEDAHTFWQAVSLPDLASLSCSRPSSFSTVRNDQVKA